jgi:hypothetical protein
MESTVTTDREKSTERDQDAARTDALRLAAMTPAERQRALLKKALQDAKARRLAMLGAPGGQEEDEDQDVDLDEDTDPATARRRAMLGL